MKRKLLYLVCAFAFCLSACKRADVARVYEDDERTQGLKLSAPILKLPIKDAEGEPLTPEFIWSAARSHQKKSLRYTLLLGKSEQLTEEDAVARDLANPSYQLDETQALEPSTKYYWQVLVSDTQLKGQELRSELRSYTTRDALPEVALLLEDKHNLGSERKIDLRWEPRNVPKLDAEGKPIEPLYNLYYKYGDDKFNNNTPTKRHIKHTSESITATRGNVNLYWKVIMIIGNEAYESAIHSVILGNTEPTAARLASPNVTLKANNEGEYKAQAQFRWEASTDPDRGDALTYDLYLAKSESFTEEDVRAPELEETTYTATNLDLETTYYCKLVTKDKHGATVESNVLSFTTPAAPLPSGALEVTTSMWTDTRDNKTYRTVTINGKTWLAENFAYLPYLEHETDGTKLCSVYGHNKFGGRFGRTDNPDVTIESSKAHPNYAKYGVLYSWAAAKDVVPSGWHMATDEEWQALERLAGMSEEDISHAGKKNNKSYYRGEAEDIAHWFFARGEGFRGDNVDKLQLSLVLGGYVKSSFEDKGVNEYTYYWVDASNHNHRAFNKKKKGAIRDNFSSSYNHRLYLRLVKD